MIDLCSFLKQSLKTFHFLLQVRFLFVSQCIFLTDNFFKGVLGSQKNWVEITEIFHMLLPSHTCIASPIIYISHKSGTFVRIDEPTHWHIIIPQSPPFTLGFTLGVVHSMGLDKCIMACYPPLLCCTEYIHCLKIPLCSAYSSFPATNP